MSRKLVNPDHVRALNRVGTVRLWRPFGQLAAGAALLARHVVTVSGGRDLIVVDWVWFAVALLLLIGGVAQLSLWLLVSRPGSRLLRFLIGAPGEADPPA